MEKNKTVTLILCIALGYLGVHRFYTGKVKSGVLYLCTGGLCGIGWIVDIILICTDKFNMGVTTSAQTASMNDQSFEKQSAQWLKLREHFQQVKRNKDYQSVIDTGLKIIDLDKRTPELGIMTALFERDIAEAYMKLGDTSKSIVYFEKAIESFKKYRASQKLHDPDDFLSDIETIQKKLNKLKS